MRICLRFLCGEFSKAKHVLLELGGIMVLVSGDRDSRANLMAIYGDLYQIKL